MIRSLSVAALLAIPADALAGPSAGQIDPTFGEFDNGIFGLQVEAFDFGGTLNDRAYAMSQDAQGRLLLAGVAEVDNGQCLGLMRFTPDGRIDDVGFGLNADQVPTGKICHPDLMQGSNLGHDLDIAMLADGGFFLAGQNDDHPYICRFRADGTIMDTFGTGAGCVVLSQIDKSAWPAPSLLLLGQSVLIVANHKTEAKDIPVLSRLSTDTGTIQSFGQEAFLPLVDHDATAWDAVLDNTGDLVLVGNVQWDVGDPDAFIARFDMQRLEPSVGFDTDGLVRFKFNKIPKGHDYLTSVTALPNGDILAAGNISLPGRTAAIIVQIDAISGATSHGFNNKAPRIYDPCFKMSGGCQTLLINGVARAGGHVVLAGDANDAIFAARLTIDGALDAEFGKTGLARIALGDDKLNGGATGLVLQDERIVLAGSANDGSDDNFALLRLSDGRLFKDEFEVPAP